MGDFFSREEVAGIDGIKTPWNHVKTEISTSKNIIYYFMQFCVPCLRHKKNEIPKHTVV